MNTQVKIISIITIPDQLIKGLSLLLMLSIIQGCSLFGGDDEDKSLLPAELIDFIETVEVDRDWKTSVGKSHEGLGVGLLPASDGAVSYTHLTLPTKRIV